MRRRRADDAEIEALALEISMSSEHAPLAYDAARWLAQRALNALRRYAAKWDEDAAISREATRRPPAA